MHLRILLCVACTMAFCSCTEKLPHHDSGPADVTVIDGPADAAGEQSTDTAHDLSADVLPDQGVDLVRDTSVDAVAVDASVDTTAPDSSVDVASTDTSVDSAAADTTSDMPPTDVSVDVPQSDLPSCGDNAVNGTEECDGTLLNGETCESLGYVGGTLSCSNCLFNTSNCEQCTHPTVTETCSGGWCTIPAGCFFMGSPSNELCRRANETRHAVKLTHSYVIKQTEVTNAEFSALMGYSVAVYCTGGTCPANNVSWHEAAEYANKRSALQGLPACYTCSGSGAQCSGQVCSAVTCAIASAYNTGGKTIYDCPGYRLPTEAEFEYAYRSGATTAIYPTAGNNGTVANCVGVNANVDIIAWYWDNSSGAPHPVAQKAKNAWGLFDIAGNLHEWTGDWYLTDLGSAGTVDPVGPASGTLRVLRGGGWNVSPQSQRAARRGDGGISTSRARVSTIGFRIVRTLPVVGTLAGDGTNAHLDGPALSARFSYPRALDADANGNVYVSDSNQTGSGPSNYSIRLVAGGQVTTFAGDGVGGYIDGAAATARFSGQGGVAVSGNDLYVADGNNQAIRKVSGGQVSTFAGSGGTGLNDGAALTATFFYPLGVAVGSGGTVYVADHRNHAIRRITGGQVSTLAGNGSQGFQDGPVASARFSWPRDVAVFGTKVYVVDESNYRIRLIENGQVTTVAGDGTVGYQDGPASNSIIGDVRGIGVDTDGRVYFADRSNNRIGVISNGYVWTLAGDGSCGYRDGPATLAEFCGPFDVAVRGNTAYVVDRNNFRIRVIRW